MWLWNPEPVNFSANICRKVWLIPLREKDLIFFFNAIEQFGKEQEMRSLLQASRGLFPVKLGHWAAGENPTTEQEAWTRLSRPQATWATVWFTILFYTDMN